MPDSADNWEKVIKGLREGDRQVINEFFREYGAPLQRLAEKNLPPGVRRRIGPEDVVQSACRTFFRRAQVGEFQLEDSDSLWRLLCAITLTKIREQTRFHLRKKRSLEQEVQLAPVSPEDSVRPYEPVAAGASPLNEAEFAEQFQQLLSALGPEEQQVVDLKLQDCTNDEVAERLGCSERTVRRILKRVQSALAKTFEVG